MVTWTKQNVNPTQDDSRNTSVLEDSYDVEVDAGQPLTGWSNYVAQSGFNASPNIHSQAIQIPFRKDTRLLDKIGVKLSKRGLPQGYFQLGFYTPGTGDYGTDLRPDFVDGLLGLSSTVDLDDVDGNGIYAVHDFTFSTDIELTPEGHYCIVYRFIGTSATTSNVRIPVATQATANEVYGGNFGQGFVGNTGFLSPDWSGMSVVSFTPSSALDLNFRLYSKNPSTRVFIPETSWDESSNPSTSWNEGPTLPSTTWEEFDSYDNIWCRDSAKFLETFDLVKESRDFVVPGRDFVGASETHDGDASLSGSEGAQILDSGLREVVERSQSYAASESAEILDSGEVDVDSRNVTYTGRDFIAVSETAIRDVEVALSESAQILDSGEVEITSRVLNITSSDFIRVEGELISLSIRAMVVMNESALILDSGEVETEERSSTFTATEYLAAGETITLDTPIAEIADAEINSELDVDTDLNRARCRFDTGVFTESCRVEVQVDGGGWNTHEDFNDVDPQTTGYVTTWYNGSSGESVQFRIRPFTANNLTGTEGNTFNTNIVSI